MAKEKKSKVINRRKDLLTAVIVAVATVATFIGASWLLGNFNDPQPVVDEKVKLEKYFEAKYGKDFVIKNAKIHIPYLDEDEVFEAKIYPADDPSQEVKVYRDVTDPSAVYNENYLGQVWERQETPGVKKYLESIYDDKTMPKYTLQVTATDEYITTVNGHTPSLKEAITTFGPKAAQVYLMIDQDKFKNNQNLDKAANEIAKISPYVTEISTEAGWTYTLQGNSKTYRCEKRFVKGTGDHAALVKCLEKSEL